MYFKWFLIHLGLDLTQLVTAVVADGAAPLLTGRRGGERHGSGPVRSDGRDQPKSSLNPDVIKTTLKSL